MLRLYVWHVNCYGMLHCLCSGLVELIVVVQSQHINIRKYSNSYAIDYTDIQPKISIDEISLLWLFCGCWTRIWYLKLLFSSCFEDTGGCVQVQGVVISHYVLSHKW